jgi:ubiquinone/menaquinone biosynthesis C-methylase UbiE
MNTVYDKARRYRPVRWRQWACFLVLTLAVLCPIGARVHAQPAAQEQSVSPGVNKSFLSSDLDVTRWVATFEGESREIFAQRQAITEAVRLQPGMTVADIGAGTGLFMELFAQKIGPEGKLYAIDIAPKFVEHLRQRAATQRLTHVTAVLGQEDAVPLPADSLDAAFVCDTYHHFEYPNSVLASIHRALRPGGALILIDFERIPGQSRQWVLDHIRADKATVTKEIEAAGFRLVEEPPIAGLKEHYFLRFAKP